MAKVKKSAKMVKENCMVDSYYPSIYLDLDSVEALKGLEVGESVTVMLQGKVKSLEQRQDYNSDKVKGCLSLADYEVKITSEDEWSELAEDEDD